SRSSVDAEVAFNHIAGLEFRGLERLLFELLKKRLQLFFAVRQTLIAGSLAHLLAAVLDEVFKLFEALEDADMRVLILAVEHSTYGCVVLRVLRHNDQIFRIDALGKRVFALLPNLRNVVAPCVAHRRDESVRAA